MIPLLRRALPPVLRRSYARFIAQLQDPAIAQQALLKELLRDSAATEYGRAHGVRADDDYQEFAARLPLIRYDDIREWIERQQQTERNVIVAERVLFYETTSGSAGVAKRIPYTRSLKDSFNRMFAVWLYDLLTHGPRFETGKLFISISPTFQQKRKTERGITVGLDDDADYLNGWMRRLLKRFFVVPPAIKHLSDADDFKHALVVLLLAEARLETISIWNPSLLEVLLDFIEANRDALMDDLRQGSIRRDGFTFKFKRASQKRLSLLDEQPIDWRRIWPHLKLISCWTDANARPAAQRLGERFPNLLIQGKGLLATEAPMTLPLIEARGCVPLAGEVFYEFIDDAGKLSRLHELTAGREYEIVMTSRGGFARYRIGDRVRATHFYQSTPCLEFIGRSDGVCDLVGEKLNETFVQSCLSQLVNLSSRFQTLLPVMAASGPSYYVLVIDELAGDVQAFAKQLDAAFCEAHHYRLARRLGQLAPLRVHIAPAASIAYYDYFIGKGMKWGDIKHQFLIRNLEDATRLLATFEASAAHCRALNG
jgi:GH3 auxin-responsive promoter